jgi:hypothetical protein
VGFPPFTLGGKLLLFCFLPNPPTIFGFEIDHGAPPAH